MTGIAPSVLWEQDPVDLVTMLDVIVQLGEKHGRA
jgi:hypothetical protein